MSRHDDFGPVPKEVFLFLAEWLMRVWKEMPGHPELCDRALHGKRGQVENWLETLLQRNDWPRDEHGYLDVTPVAGETTATVISTAMRRCLAVASRENGLRRCVQTAKDGDTFRLCWGGPVTDRRTPIRRIVWFYRACDADSFTDAMKLGAMRMAKQLGIGIAFVEACVKGRNARGLLDKCLESVSFAGSDEDRRNSTAVVWDREGTTDSDHQAALLEFDGFRTITVGPPSAMVRRDHIAVGAMLADHILTTEKHWPIKEGKSRQVFLMPPGTAFCKYQFAEILGGLQRALAAENRRLPVFKYDVREVGWRQEKCSEQVDAWGRVGLEAGDCVVAVDLVVDWQFCRALRRYDKYLQADDSLGTGRSFQLLYACSITAESLWAMGKYPFKLDAICGVSPEAYGAYVVRVASRLDTQAAVSAVAPTLLPSNVRWWDDSALAISSVFARPDVQLEDGEYCWEEWMVRREEEEFTASLPPPPCKC